MGIDRNARQIARAFAGRFLTVQHNQRPRGSTCGGVFHLRAARLPQRQSRHHSQIATIAQPSPLGLPRDFKPLFSGHPSRAIPPVSLCPEPGNGPLSPFACGQPTPTKKAPAERKGRGLAVATGASLARASGGGGEAPGRIQGLALARGHRRHVHGRPGAVAGGDRAGRAAGHR